jgi:hypothetical protein
LAWKLRGKTRCQNFNPRGPGEDPPPGPDAEEEWKKEQRSRPDSAGCHRDGCKLPQKEDNSKVEVQKRRSDEKESMR